MDTERAWRALLDLVRRRRAHGTGGGEGIAAWWRDELDRAQAGGAPSPEARALLRLYLPLCAHAGDRFVVAHLGQSLDGRIAACNGASQWVTGPEDVAHNHRMRALFDAVVVGAGTVRHDDPQLTVRLVEGDNPVRVVLDARRSLPADCGVFTDGEAPTLLVCAQELAGRRERLGAAEVVGVPARDGALDHRGLLDRLAERGLRRVFVEGGGITVSRFLRAGCLNRLQITVAPVIIGSGRPGISLPEVDDLARCLRPPTRRFDFGDDVMFECVLDDGG